MIPFLNQPFVQITLPLMITFVASIWASTWMQNKRLEEMSKRIDGRLDDLSKRIDELSKRVDRILDKLEDHNERIVKLESARWR